MRSWRHSGFSVDNSVRIAKGDKAGMQRLILYIARCPFSLTRMVSITKDGKILYRASYAQCIPFPLSGDTTLMKGVPRNYELYDPLDFLAEVTQHIVTSFSSLTSTGAAHLFRYVFCRVQIKENIKHDIMAFTRIRGEVSS